MSALLSRSITVTKLDQRFLILNSRSTSKASDSELSTTIFVKSIWTDQFWILFGEPSLVIERGHSIIWDTYSSCHYSIIHSHILGGLFWLKYSLLLQAILFCDGWRHWGIRDFLKSSLLSFIFHREIRSWHSLQTGSRVAFSNFNLIHLFNLKGTKRVGQRCYTTWRLYSSLLSFLRFWMNFYYPSSI